jgi:hypothetical protein
LAWAISATACSIRAPSPYLGPVGFVDHVLRRHVGAGPNRDVLGQVDDHRPGATAAGDVESLVDGPRQVVGALDQVIVLGARAGDPGGVALLEGVVADQVGGHLTAEADDRHAVHQRVGQSGHRIGGARTRGHDDHPDLAGGAGIAFGAVHRAPFLADENMADPVLLKQLVVYRQDGAPGITEYIRDALIHERPKDNLCTGHLVVRHDSALLCRRGSGPSRANLVGKRPGAMPGRPMGEAT